MLVTVNVAFAIVNLLVLVSPGNVTGETRVRYRMTDEEARQAESVIRRLRRSDVIDRHRRQSWSSWNHDWSSWKNDWSSWKNDWSSWTKEWSNQRSHHESSFKTFSIAAPIAFGVFFVIIVIVMIVCGRRACARQAAMRRAAAVSHSAQYYNGQTAAPGCPLSQYMYPPPAAAPNTALPPGAYPVQPQPAVSASPPLPPATNVVTSPTAPPPSYSEVVSNK